MRKTSPGRYRHVKGGEYFVLFEAIDATNGQHDRKVVVYANGTWDSVFLRTLQKLQKLQKLGRGKTFVRDAEEFRQQVVDPKTNKLVRRFSKIAVRKSR